MIHVCPLSRVAETVNATRARRLVSLLSAGTMMARPEAIAEADHLFLSMHDIAEPQEGLILPGEAEVERLLAFGQSWDRSLPLVIHCYAGISRSTASAYIIAAQRNPARDEFALAAALRRASPTATPNPRLIALADRLLGRDGRMVEAIRGIGRGADAFEAVPFSLAVDAPHEQRATS